MNRRRLLRRLLSGQVANVRFTEFVALVESFGFDCVRVAGSHRIYRHPGIPVQINLQDVAGEAKPYQVRQFLRLVEEHDLQVESDP